MKGEERPGEVIPSIAIAFSGALWGLFWIPLRYFDQGGVGAAEVAVIFFAVALIATLPFIATATGLWSRGAGLLLPGLMTGGAFALYAVSLVHTEVVRALLLFYLTPVWSTVLGLILYRRAVTPHRLIALVLGVAGLLVVLDYQAGIPLPRNVGDWMALLSGLAWACGTTSLYSGRLRLAENVVAFSLGGLVSATLILLLPVFVGNGLPISGLTISLLPAILSVALLAFLPTTALIIWGSQRVDPGRVGILLMTELVVGAVSAGLLSGEAFGLRELAGTLLILGAGTVEMLAPAPTPRTAG